jgi:hypothetical protein
MKLTPHNIEQMKQNKIKYVVKDFQKYGIVENITRNILLARGFNKWIANRMEFIRLKEKYKYEITAKLRELCEAKRLKQHYHTAKIKGELKILVRVRQDIRKICHSPRRQFPD